MERGLPSILLAAQGKSASASVGNLFSSGFLLAPAVYSLIDQSIVAPWLADYLRGGACYTTHLNPHRAQHRATRRRRRENHRRPCQGPAAVRDFSRGSYPQIPDGNAASDTSIGKPTRERCRDCRDVVRGRCRLDRRVGQRPGTSCPSNLRPSRNSFVIETRLSSVACRYTAATGNISTATSRCGSMRASTITAARAASTSGANS